MSTKRKAMDPSEEEINKKARLNTHSTAETDGTTSEGGMMSESSENDFDSEDDGPEEFEWAGDLDAKGLYTGQAGLKYVGIFSKGEMGPGELILPDGSKLTGDFVEGALTGPGSFTSKEGTKMVGNFEENLLSGHGKELYPDGALFFEGEYVDGVREGKGVMYYTDECAKIEGTWVEGVLEGEATYYYPDNSTLKGIWEHGVLKSGKFNSIIDPSFNTDLEYTHDESTKKRIAKYPLRRDPYEAQYCYAKKSEILQDADEGLFASRDIPANFIVSLYNGIRISLKNGEKKEWKLKPNLICLNDGMCVDVPVELSSLSVFQNTIGHKANHHYNNNAKYELYWAHPIYGKIRCIKTIKPVKKDEEIFVDYGYEEGDGPEWYHEFMKGHFPKKKEENK